MHKLIATEVQNFATEMFPSVRISLDHGVDATTQVIVLQANDRDISDLGMLAYYRFYFRRENIGAARDNQVGATIREIEITLVVKPAQVSDAGEALIQGFQGR